MKRILYLLPFTFLLSALKLSSSALCFKDESTPVIAEAFFTLDTVWTPGVRNKYPLFPFDNYLLIKDGVATLIMEEVRGISFRGPINDVKFVDEDGKRITTFAVRNAKMRIELREQEDDRYEIYAYRYLGEYERMFVATWIDLSKVSISFDD